MLFEGPDDVGEVTRFEMTLHELRQSGGQTCAVFKTQIEASSAATTQMTIHVGGTAVVETNTCRVVELRFSGPVALADTSGPVGARYFVNGRGKLHVAMAAKYDVGKRK